MPTYERVDGAKPLYRVAQVIWFVLYVIEVILLFRFALRALGANSAAAFTDFVYSISRPFVDPFMNVISPTTVNGSVIEWSTLLAMFVYWLLALIIVRLLATSRPVTNAEAEYELRQRD